MDGNVHRAGTPRETRILHTLCAVAANSMPNVAAVPGGTTTIARAGRRPLQVLVAPARRRPDPVFGGGCPAAIVFAVDPEASGRPDAELIQEFFGLTPTEARIAVCLAEGRELEEVAAECRYTRETVKWYSKQILARTGCRNRAELVRLIERSLASLRTSVPRASRDRSGSTDLIAR